MVIDTTATTAALVLCTAFTQLGPVMAGDTDGGDLAVLHFPCIRGLIGLPVVTTQVVDITVLIVIVVSKSGIHASLEGLKVHGIGVKHVLVFDFGVIPRFGDMDLIGVGLGILTTLAFAQDIRQWVVADAVGEAVIGMIELLDTASTPSCMLLGVLQCSLPLGRRRLKVRIPSVNPVPMVAVKNGIVIRGRIIVTQVDTAPVDTVDIPSLGIVLSHTFTGIVADPRAYIVVGEIEKICNAFFSTNEVE